MKKICTSVERNLNISEFESIIPGFSYFVKKKAAASAAAQGLLLPEGHAVGALVNGRIGFMGTHQNPVQRTVVLVAAMMGALCYGAFDAFVGMAVHIQTSFEMNSVSVCAAVGKICGVKLPNIAF